MSDFEIYLTEIEAQQQKVMQAQADYLAALLEDDYGYPYDDADHYLGYSFYEDEPDSKESLLDSNVAAEFGSDFKA